jgi:hypothetical protein
MRSRLGTAAQLRAQTAVAARQPALGAVLTTRTAKGDIQIRLFQSTRQERRAHLELVKRNYYRAQRFHRVERLSSNSGIERLETCRYPLLGTGNRVPRSASARSTSTSTCVGRSRSPTTDDPMTVRQSDLHHEDREPVRSTGSTSSLPGHERYERGGRQDHDLIKNLTLTAGKPK